jgi:hypothetical protein
MSSTQQSIMTTTAKAATPAKSKEVIMHDAAAQDPVANEAWKHFPKDTVPFLAVPPEIHLKIFSFLNPIDSVCLSLVKYVSSQTSYSLTNASQHLHLRALTPLYARNPPTHNRRPQFLVSRYKN